MNINESAGDNTSQRGTVAIEFVHPSQAEWRSELEASISHDGAECKGRGIAAKSMCSSMGEG